jgi:hypothetical protein
VRKIPTVFVRDPENRSRVLPEVTPGCEWVLAGEGKATRKYDGTCVMLDDAGQWWNRREIRDGKTMPEDAIDLGINGITVPMHQDLDRLNDVLGYRPSPSDPRHVSSWSKLAAARIVNR